MTNAILLVEDNEMDIVLTLDAFGQILPEAAIHVARNGREALDYLFGVGKYEDRERYPLPDLVLLDLKMPGINGHDVLCHLSFVQNSAVSIRRCKITWVLLGKIVLQEAF